MSHDIVDLCNQLARAVSARTERDKRQHCCVVQHLPGECDISVYQKAANYSIKSIRLSPVARSCRSSCRKPFSSAIPSLTSALLSSRISSTGKLCQSTIILKCQLISPFKTLHQLRRWRKQVHRDLERRDVFVPSTAALLLLRLPQEIDDFEVSSNHVTTHSSVIELFPRRPKFKILRFLVLQFVVVHVIIFVTLNLISIESPETFENVMVFFVPFITATIILGVWGFQITIRMLVPYYANLNLLKKFISFQLVLILCKLQPILLELIMKQFVSGCTGPFTVVIKIRCKSRRATQQPRF